MTVTPNHGPATLASLLAVLAGAIGLLSIASTGDHRLGVLVQLLGLGTLAGAYRVRKVPVVAIGLAVLGLPLVVAGVLLAVISPEAIVHQLELLPGLLGLTIVFLALLPLRQRLARPLLIVGTGFLFATVVTSGVFRTSSTAALLIAGIAMILAWDFGEQAISLGRQLGRHSSSYRASLPHAVGTLGAGGLTVFVGLVVFRMEVDTIPLEVLLLLLLTGVTLVIAMEH